MISSSHIGGSKHALTLSVRELVEYTMRSGDLNLIFFSSERPVQAMRVHQSIQGSRPEGYSAEVQVQHEIEVHRYRLNITGRVDGIFSGGRRVVIDEIKTTRKLLETVRAEEDRVHWGQAKCYAYMYAAQHGLDEIDVQLTYYQMDQEKITEIRRTYTTAKLDVFFHALVSAYIEWIDTVVDWIETRNHSIERMHFPFVKSRSGQAEMIKATASAIEDRATLLIQAPTGIGKTMAVIFPALQAIARGLTAKLFYLTARTTGRNVVEHSLDILRRNGLRLKHVSLTAKEKVCFNIDKSCQAEECIYARGYYDRLNDALVEAFGQESLTRDVIVGIAEKRKVCPFEFALELSLWVDCIICDYNYVFDPSVYLRRFFEDGHNDNVILIDEAHNLVDRSRDMYSATLNRLSMMRMRKHLRKALPALHRSMTKINAWMMEARKQIPENETALACEDFPVDLCQLLRKFTASAEKWLSTNEQSAYRQELLDVYFEVRKFLSTADRYDSSYATYYTRSGKDFSVTLFCLDPSRHLEEVLRRCAAAIYLSATLTPFGYFAKLFGCGDNVRSLSLPSPFPSSNLCVLIAGRISALYRYREFTKHEVAKMVGALINQKKGNYLMFFPSYEYMRMIYEIVQKRCPGVKVIVQSPRMSEKERDAFLAHFNEQIDGTMIGFVVMGGVFAESIDLVGERLTGAAIVGVGFPQISIERELIKLHFDGIDGSGYAYAYQVPGMIKVLQAAGRVIRSEDDRGVVLLIDTRYSGPPYREMLPREWRPAFVDNVERTAAVLREFWAR